MAGKLNKPKAYFYSRKCIFYFLLILVQDFSLVETSIIADCAARLFLTRDFDWSVTEKVTGNTQPGASVEVLPGVS